MDVRDILNLPGFTIYNLHYGIRYFEVEGIYTAPSL